jgi:hypothetical protein
MQQQSEGMGDISMLSFQPNNLSMTGGNSHASSVAASTGGSGANHSSITGGNFRERKLMALAGTRASSASVSSYDSGSLPRTPEKWLDSSRHSNNSFSFSDSALSGIANLSYSSASGQPGAGASASASTTPSSSFFSPRKAAGAARRKEGAVHCIGELSVHSDAVTRLLSFGDDQLLFCSSDKLVLLWSMREAHSERRAESVSSALEKAAGGLASVV